LTETKQFVPVAIASLTALAQLHARPTYAVEPFEIEVYDGEANEPGTTGLELHANAVRCPNSVCGHLRRLSTVVVQQSSNPFASNDCAWASEICRVTGDQGVAQALVVAFLIIVSSIFRDCPTEMPLPNRHDFI
jgi:hypothetical protein